MTLIRKIISIKRKGQKRSKRLLIFDDQSVFGISEDVFVSTGLEVGSKVDEKYLLELEQKENDYQAFHAEIGRAHV